MSDPASKPSKFLGFRTTDCLNAEWLTRKRAAWQWFRSLSTRDDQHRQEVPGEARGDWFPLELTSTSRLLHLVSLTLRTLYSCPVLRRQARCIHLQLFGCECVYPLLPDQCATPASSPWKARIAPTSLLSSHVLPHIPWETWLFWPDFVLIKPSLSTWAQTRGLFVHPSPPHQ